MIKMLNSAVPNLQDMSVLVKKTLKSREGFLLSLGAILTFVACFCTMS